MTACMCATTAGTRASKHVHQCASVDSAKLSLLQTLDRPAGEQDGEKRRLLAQVATIDASYHGGLLTYLRNAKQLLADSKLGAVKGRCIDACASCYCTHGSAHACAHG